MQDIGVILLVAFITYTKVSFARKPTQAQQGFINLNLYNLQSFSPCTEVFGSTVQVQKVMSSHRIFYHGILPPLPAFPPFDGF